MVDEYMTYYVETNCEHCGKEIIIKISAKSPIVKAEQDYDPWKDFKENQTIDFGALDENNN